MNIFAGRAQLVGDLISSLPIATLIKKKYPGCRLTWPVAQKSKQVIPFIKNHPLIDEIALSEDFEGNIYKFDGKEYNQKTDKLPFDLQLDCNPSHIRHLWYNYTSLVYENLNMAGFTQDDVSLLNEQEIKPFLIRENPPKKKPKTITFQTTAGYGQASDRSPSKEWWQKFFEQAKEELPDFQFIQVGHPKDYKIEGVEDIFETPFYNQFDYILASDLYLGVENGISWINGAYGTTPMVSLLTNAFYGHNQNFLAWEPKHYNNKNLSVFAQNGCSNIKYEEVFACMNYFLEK